MGLKAPKLDLKNILIEENQVKALYNLSKYLNRIKKKFNFPEINFIILTSAGQILVLYTVAYDKTYLLCILHTSIYRVATGFQNFFPGC